MEAFQKNQTPYSAHTLEALALGKFVRESQNLKHGRIMRIGRRAEMVMRWPATIFLSFLDTVIQGKKFIATHPNDFLNVEDARNYLAFHDYLKTKEVLIGSVLGGAGLTGAWVMAGKQIAMATFVYSFLRTWALQRQFAKKSKGK